MTPQNDLAARLRAVNRRAFALQALIAVTTAAVLFGLAWANR